VASSPAGFIIFLFLTSRVVLTIIGVASRLLLDSFHGREFPWHYSTHSWLSIWAVWDSGWYLDIAKSGYALSVLSDLPKAIDPHQLNFGFFPLYPMLVGFVSRIFGGHLFISGIAVSNVCLLCAAWFLHKLVALDHGPQNAKRAVLFLFAFPTSFVLSGVFAESLFLLISILLFYGMKKEKFLFVFACGILLGLSRPTAVFAVPAVCLAYLAGKHFDIRKIGISSLCCIGVPVGYGLFALFGYSVTGDWFFYTHIKQVGWGSVWTNPLSLLVHCLMSHQVSTLGNGTAVASGCIFIVALWKRIGMVYGILGLSLLVLPLTAGFMVIPGMMRYMAALFPLFVACAALREGSVVDTAMITGLFMLQGFLMVFWTNGFSLIV